LRGVERVFNCADQVPRELSFEGIEDVGDVGFGYTEIGEMRCEIGEYSVNVWLPFTHEKCYEIGLRTICTGGGGDGRSSIGCRTRDLWGNSR